MWAQVSPQPIADDVNRSMSLLTEISSPGATRASNLAVLAVAVDDDDSVASVVVLVVVVPYPPSLGRLEKLA